MMRERERERERERGVEKLPHKTPLSNLMPYLQSGETVYEN